MSMTRKQSASSVAGLTDITIDDVNDTDGIKSVFDEHGCLLIKNGLPRSSIDDLIEQIKVLMIARMKSVGIFELSDEDCDIDQLYNKMRSANEQHAYEIFEVVTELEGYFDLMHHPINKKLAKLVMGAEFLITPFANSLFRIDRPIETRFLFSWHQDMTYNLMNKNAATFWMPLRDVTEDMGRLVVVPGTHQRVEPVMTRNANWAQGSGGGGQLFVYCEMDEDDLENRGVAVPADAGDILILHGCTLHRSGPNRSDRSRWVINTRYGDPLDNELVDRAWLNGVFSRGRLRNNFHEIYPDLYKGEVPAPHAGE